jgi:hypothetical protein
LIVIACSVIGSMVGISIKEKKNTWDNSSIF